MPGAGLTPHSTSAPFSTRLQHAKIFSKQNILKLSNLGLVSFFDPAIDIVKGFLPNLSSIENIRYRLIIIGSTSTHHPAKRSTTGNPVAVIGFVARVGFKWPLSDTVVVPWQRT